MAQIESPPLTSKAREQSTNIVAHFECHLLGVAETIASNHAAENVLVPHVNEALLTIKRTGLEPQAAIKLTQKPEFRITLGGILLGLAPSVSSFAKDIIQSYGELDASPYAFWTWMISIPLALGFIGLGLTIAGWMSDVRQSNSPQNQVST